ncbi:MAG TPA: hypothetical protein VD967_03385 [Candidatus Paceibacterota bacterium]|nr:hypothetical protein [Candidatus Paceibacterota bacterium]
MATLRTAWKYFFRSFRAIAHSFRDLAVLLLPERASSEYAYAFIVHPRDIRDVYRQYPFLRAIPPFLIKLVLRFYWPVIISRVSGLASAESGKEIRGFVLAVPLTAEQMLEDRPLARRKIIQAARLAKKSGAKIIGLGGLTASMSRGGLDVTENVKINVTTGHAYTAHNVSQNLFNLTERFGLSKQDVLVAVVGAAGSIGSSTAQVIVREGYSRILLVEVERKKEAVQKLLPILEGLNPDANIAVSHSIEAIREADFIITATNTPEALVRPEHLKPGAVVIDDAQPSDVAPEVLTRQDVLVVEAGVVHTPEIRTHFDFNLKGKNDTFCCMAELLILAAHGWNDHYTIARTDLERVDTIASWGRALNFRPAAFQNFLESISEERLERVSGIARRVPTEVLR